MPASASLGQMKVMSAIEHCRTAALGGHAGALRVRQVRPHGHRLQQLPQPALPEVPGRAAKEWLAEREAELLPVGYFQCVVFTLPGPIADIADQNKAVVLDLFFKASAETVLTSGATHASRRQGRLLAVLHTWVQP